MKIESVTNFKSMTPPFTIEMDGGEVDIGYFNEFAHPIKVVNFSPDKTKYFTKIFSHWWNLKNEQNLYVTIIHDFPAPMPIDDTGRNFTKKLIVKPYEGELDFLITNINK